MLSSILDKEPMSKKDCEIKADKYLQEILEFHEHYAAIENMDKAHTGNS